ncbi:MAG: thioredoxin [Deltaproteobacteria bacterium]|nr:thioredoxin [Deltaproteobacteria bacterium]
MAGSKNVHVWNEQNFPLEVLQASGPVLVDFTATWCGPCRLLAPVIEELADKYAGKIKVGKVDIDASPGLAAKYGVRSVPTVMLFEAGAKKASHVGVAKLDKLVALAGL